METAERLDPRMVTKDTAREILGKWNRVFSSYTSSMVYDFTLDKAIKSYELDGRLGRWSDSADESVITDWCILGLDWIMSCTGNQPGFSQPMEKVAMDWNRRTTDALTDALEDAIKEATDERQEEYEYDPEDFRKWHNGKDIDECEHPWCDETVTLARLWMSMHPFEWYTLYSTAEEWGFVVVREHLRAYALEVEDSKDVAQTIQRRLDEVMQKWAKRVEEGRW